MLQETMCADFEKRVLTGYQQGTASISTIGSETLLSDMKDRVNKIKESGPAEPMEYLHAWVKLEGREIEVDCVINCCIKFLKGFFGSYRPKRKVYCFEGETL